MASKKLIEICCYNSIELWHSRELAIKFYREGVECCEGCERERYVNILLDLLDGKFVCVDESSICDKITQYNWCRENKRIKKFATPDNTRDYGGKVHYPLEK